MKINIWFIGKTDEDYLSIGIEKYAKKLSHYIPTEVVVIPNPKAGSQTDKLAIKRLEGELILKKLQSEDFLVLLDEKGKRFTSMEFSEVLNGYMNRGLKRVVFLIGGAFGFSPEVYARANAKLSLSDMTFSHQMIRLFLLEQLYRGYSILRNEPYHNQ